MFTGFKKGFKKAEPFKKNILYISFLFQRLGIVVGVGCGSCWVGEGIFDQLKSYTTVQCVLDSCAGLQCFF